MSTDKERGTHMYMTKLAELAERYEGKGGQKSGHLRLPFYAWRPRKGQWATKKRGKMKERCKRFFWLYDLCLIAVATVLEGQSGTVGTVPEGQLDDRIAFRHCRNGASLLKRV